MGGILSSDSRFSPLANAHKVCTFLDAFDRFGVNFWSVGLRPKDVDWMVYLQPFCSDASPLLSQLSRSVDRMLRAHVDASSSMPQEMKSTPPISFTVVQRRKRFPSVGQ